MQKHASEFKDLNTELIFVYREESEGVAGLKKIQSKVDTDYHLCLDANKESAKTYSPKRGTFDNYVIDSRGIVRGIVDGTLRDRAKAEELMKILRKIEGEKN